MDKVYVVLLLLSCGGLETLPIRFPLSDTEAGPELRLLPHRDWRLVLRRGAYLQPTRV